MSISPTNSSQICEITPLSQKELCPFQFLPNDILIHIFQYTRHQEYEKNTALVCKRFHCIVTKVLELEEPLLAEKAIFCSLKYANAIGHIEMIRGNIFNAFNWFKDASLNSQLSLLAQQPNTPVAAFFNLGECFRLGKGTPIDLHQAGQRLSFAASKNVTPALITLADHFDEFPQETLPKNISRGQLYLIAAMNCREGIYTEKSQAQSIVLLQKAVELQSAQASFELGCLYENGEGVPKDVKKAMELYELPAKNQHIGAIHKLAAFFSEGIIVPQDMKKVFSLYLEGAKLKDLLSMYTCALFYKEGRIVPQNPIKAFELFSYGIEKNHAPSMYELARCYEMGTGTEIDLQAAIILYTNAYLKGIIAGNIREKVCSIKLKRPAPNLSQETIDTILANDLKDVEALELLANCYLNGDLITKDEKKAFDLYSKIVEKDPSRTRAMYNLGCCYAEGLGTTSDPIKALKNFREADSKGFKPAKVALATEADLYYETYTSALDERERADLYFQAAECVNDPDLQNEWFKKSVELYLSSPKILPHEILRIASCYGEGKGVEKDEQKALLLIREQSADGKGDTSAVVEEALILLNGLYGVPVDTDAAMVLLQKAAKEKDPAAIFHLGQVCVKHLKIAKDFTEASEIIFQKVFSQEKESEFTQEDVFQIIEGEAIKKKDADVLFSIAHCYTTTNQEKKDELLQLAAANDHTEALYILGKQYLSKGPLDAGSALMLKAATLGHGNAMYEMSLIDGPVGFSLLSEEDKKMWFDKAIEAEAPLAALDQAKNWATKNDRASREQAFRWYSKAAKGNIKEAFSGLSNCYMHGHGVARDPNAATYYLCKAASLGSDVDQSNIMHSPVWLQNLSKILRLGSIGIETNKELSMRCLALLAINTIFTVNVGNEAMDTLISFFPNTQDPKKKAVQYVLDVQISCKKNPHFANVWEEIVYTDEDVLGLNSNS